jgi:hypothetical protein
MAAERPGMLFSAMKLATAFSMARRFSGEKLFCCAEAGEMQKQINKERRMARIHRMLFLDNGVRVGMGYSLGREFIAT